MKTVNKAKRVVDRRRSGEFDQLTVFLKREQIAKIKYAIALRRMTQSEAVEEAMDLWLEEQDKVKPE